MNSLLKTIETLSVPLEPIPTGIALRLKPLDGIETILFDLYGTLLISGEPTDSTEALTQALIVSGYEGDVERAAEVGAELLHQETKRWHHAGQERGIKFPAVEISRVWKKVITEYQTLGLLKPDDDPQKIIRLAVEYVCRATPAWPMPAALETLENLHARGFKLGIIANAQFYTPLILEALFGKSLKEIGFNEALCVFSYKEMKAKPSTELFQKIAEKIDPKTTLYVGNDLLNDLAPAAQIGCRTVLFGGDQRSLHLHEENKNSKKIVPDAIVDHLHQITEMV